MNLQQQIEDKAKERYDTEWHLMQQRGFIEGYNQAIQDQGCTPDEVVKVREGLEKIRDFRCDGTFQYKHFQLLQELATEALKPTNP